MIKNLRRTDSELKTAVSEELKWTPSVNSAHIGVAVNDGAVTLSGEADSYPEKRLAERAALRVRGVTAVAEEITVKNKWAAVNDTDIAREASEAIERAVDLPAGSVKAEVRDHVITLSGQVPWQYQREAASRTVRYLKGVTDVVNTVTIRPTVSAAGIKTAIGGALVRSAQFEAKHTTVTADSLGVVTLEGTVHSWSERQAAAHAAWSAPGVTDVINRLYIQN